MTKKTVWYLGLCAKSCISEYCKKGDIEQMEYLGPAKIFQYSLEDDLALYLYYLFLMNEHNR